ncbi:Atu4866 domain-containing protein [Desemzia sp. FAM 24101]|uniref:Atu4866 domain-containing protein n=1 Tax=unclassified Desemzia TaxID=2685243 RepID=UPI0038892824
MVTNNHIKYADDTGFTADGTFIDGVLTKQVCNVFRRRRSRRDFRKLILCKKKNSQ